MSGLPSHQSTHCFSLYIYYVCEYYYCFCLANVPQALVTFFETFSFVIIYLLMGPWLPCLSQCCKLEFCRINRLGCHDC